MAHAMPTPYWNGKKRWGVYPGVGGALLLSLLLAVGVCMCAREEEERLKGLVPIILRSRPVRWVSLRPCTAYDGRAGFICYRNAGSH